MALSSVSVVSNSLRLRWSLGKQVLIGEDLSVKRASPPTPLQELYMHVGTHMTRDLGDFQTPPNWWTRCSLFSALWDAVAQSVRADVLHRQLDCRLLRGEPPPQEIRGFEIQDRHLRKAGRWVDRKPEVTVNLRTADIFQMDLRKDLSWNHSGPLWLWAILRG